jgi:AraC-like DNA-binding protein
MSDYDRIHLIVVQSGQLWWTVRGHDTCLEAGAWLLLRRHGPVELSCRGQGYRGTGVVIADWDELTGDPVRLDPDRDMVHLADLIDRELEASRCDGPVLLEPLGWALMRLCQRQLSGAGFPDPSVEWAERARRRLEVELGSGRSVAAILAGLGLGYRQLARHFTARFGISPKAWHLNRRLEEAARMLSTSEASVLAIAMELGFPSAQHFATSFSRRYGSAPGLWRRQR